MDNEIRQLMKYTVTLVLFFKEFSCLDGSHNLNDLSDYHILRFIIIKKESLQDYCRYIKHLLILVPQIADHLSNINCHVLI